MCIIYSITVKYAVLALSCMAGRLGDTPIPIRVLAERVAVSASPVVLIS